MQGASADARPARPFSRMLGPKCRESNARVT